MAKLYWRVKKNGKWTWRPARTKTMLIPDDRMPGLSTRSIVVEEEE